jgi:hypothetical protein
MFVFKDDGCTARDTIRFRPGGLTRPCCSSTWRPDADLRLLFGHARSG